MDWYTATLKPNIRHYNGKVLEDDFPILAWWELWLVPWSVLFVILLRLSLLESNLQPKPSCGQPLRCRLYMKRTMKIAPPSKTTKQWQGASSKPTCFQILLRCWLPLAASMAWHHHQGWELVIAPIGLGEFTVSLYHQVAISCDVLAHLAGIKETDVSQALTAMGTLEMGENMDFWLRFDYGHHWTNKRVSWFAGLGVEFQHTKWSDKSGLEMSRILSSYEDSEHKWLNSGFFSIDSD